MLITTTQNLVNITIYMLRHGFDLQWPRIFLKRPARTAEKAEPCL
jgi:hypothetical protein